MAVAERLPQLKQDTDILVLPEMFTTGFIQDPILLDQASSFADATIAAVKGWSSRFNIAIAGSFQTKEGRNTYNRGFFIEPSGEASFYDKRHLFCTPSGDQVSRMEHIHDCMLRFEIPHMVPQPQTSI